MPHEKYPLLFSPIKVRNTVFRNRIMATPTSLSWADPWSGAPEDMTLFYYEDKARGGAASVTMSETTISREHGASRGVGHYVTAATARFPLSRSTTPVTSLSRSSSAGRTPGAPMTTSVPTASTSRG